MVSWRKHPLAFSALWTVGLAVSGLAVASHTIPLDARTADPERALIDTLNDCVQTRFKDVDDRFGLARMPLAGPHNASFLHPCDRATEKQLEDARLRVVSYLSGRGVLQPKPETGRSGRADAIAWVAIKGPFDVTDGVWRDTAGQSVPSALDIWDETRRALETFTRSETYEFAAAGWQFAVRPIRASDQSCLNCHTQNGATLMSAGVRSRKPLRVGDAIGAMVYGYQRVR